MEAVATTGKIDGRRDIFAAMGNNFQEAITTIEKLHKQFTAIDAKAQKSATSETYNQMHCAHCDKPKSLPQVSGHWATSCKTIEYFFDDA